METLYGGQLHSQHGTAVTIGNFDGLHLGHAKLLADLKREAARENLHSLVYTFQEHPLSFLKNGVPVITDREEKTRLMEAHGADILYYDDFQAVRDYSPEEFVKEILLDKLHMKMAVIGENNRFGKNSLGDAKMLCALGEQYGFPVYVTKSLTIDGVVCSSTEIRKSIETGDVKRAARLLGRPFSIRGEVVDGKHLGRTYGFPTANILPKAAQLLPQKGVYATNTIVDNCVYPSITNVGKTSFDKDKVLRIETHILDFHENVYGKTIQIEFMGYMRDIRAFCSTNELEQQLIQDRKTRKEMEEMI